jgi:cell division protein FtsB
MANDLYEKDNHIKKLIEDSNKIIKEKLIEEGKFKDILMKQIEKNNILKKDNDDFYKYKNNVEIDIDIFKKNINSLKKENKQLKEDMKNFKDPETIKE